MRFLKSEEERGAGERTDRIRTLEERLHRDANPDRRWEYHVLRIGPKARAEHQLNELGTKGWQLVQVIETEGHLAFYMERELPPRSEEQDAEEAADESVDRDDGNGDDGDF